MLQFNIELTVVIASRTKRRRNVFLMFGQHHRKWYSIMPTKKSESRNLKFQSISHNNKKNKQYLKWSPKNAQNVVQTLLLLEKSQFSSSSSKLIQFNNGLKGKKLGQRSQPPKGTSTPPEGFMHALCNNPANAFPRYHPKTELIIRHQLKSIMASKSKVKN